MSKHAMKMGFYTINLGTERGQKLHSCHLVILPLIPILILLMQYATAYSSNITKISKVSFSKKVEKSQPYFGSVGGGANPGDQRAGLRPADQAVAGGEALRCSQLLHIVNIFAS